MKQLQQTRHCQTEELAMLPLLIIDEPLMLTCEQFIELNDKLVASYQKHPLCGDFYGMPCVPHPKLNGKYKTTSSSSTHG
jgi:hypothetical protein